MARIEVELSELKNRAAAELKEINANLSATSSKLTEALMKINQAQEANALQVASLQAALTSAVGKAHDLELQVARRDALLQSKGLKTD